jgi:EAL domain-containing protein (putative c-di-GMP-specific phosphodiesterase class I)
VMGAKVSLDDFGTGYSSLSYVHRLPLDSIKIDRSFIREITTNERARGIVSAIVSMCAKLQLPCISEGIETEMELQLMREYGCQCGQGYYFGEPISLADVRSFVAVRAPAVIGRTDDAPVSKSPQFLRHADPTHH